MQEWLSKLEMENDIEILYACEAGSRANGTASQHSDFDVRFIFLHKNNRTYLSLREPFRVLDFSEPYDAVGWDIFKAFELMLKSNPSLLEWAFSHLVYKNEQDFQENLQGLIMKGYSPYSLFQHYYQLLNKNIKSVKEKPYSMTEQKKLYYGMRAFIILEKIIKYGSINEDLLVFEKDDKYSETYQLLANAKREHYLLSKAVVERIMAVIEESSLSWSKKSNSLPTGAPIVDELNQVLWNLLKV